MFEKHNVIEENIEYQKNREVRKEKGIAKGKEIYKEDCIMCHQKEKKGIDILIDIDKRMTKQYFALYITKHDSLRLANDPYLIKMTEKFNNAAAKHDFVYTKEEMNYLIEYVMQ